MTASSGAHVAVVGCGAVSSIYYAPALARLVQDGRVRRVTAFDPHAERARAFANLAGAELVETSFEDLLTRGADLLIVASPPTLHAAQSIAAMEAGMDVLCEKPVATSAAEATAMIDAATRTVRRLFAGQVRRQFPATRAIADVVHSGLLGDIREVTSFEGGPFAWPIAGPSYFSRASSGGGVLQDIGTHCLDLLQWWFGQPRGVHYEDDAFGGVEANCLARLDYGSFQATMRLSRDWARPNVYRIVGSKGWLTWSVNEALNFDFHLAGNTHSQVLMAAVPGSSPDDFQQAFIQQILGAMPAGTGGTELQSVLPTISLIERCYTDRVAMQLPWLAPEEAARAVALPRVPR